MNSITIALKSCPNGERQYIMACSPRDDESATAPAGWVLRFDHRDRYGYAAMFTRIRTDVGAVDIVTVSFIYSVRHATVTEITAAHDSPE